MVFPDQPQSFESQSEFIPGANPELAAVGTLDSAQELGRIRKSLRAARYAIETAIVGAEVLPVNEVMRFGAFAAVQASTQNSLAAGAALGAATFVVEGSAALATADLMDTHHGQKVMNWANDKFRKVVKPDTKMTPVVEAGVGYMGGSSVVMIAKQLEDPTRDVAKNRRHGMFTAGWMSAVLTAQGIAAANGINNPEPTSIGAALVATGGVVAAANWAKNRRASKLDQELSE